MKKWRVFGACGMGFAIVGLVLYGAVGGVEAPSTDDPDADFMASIRTIAHQSPGLGTETGLLDASTFAQGLPEIYIGTENHEMGKIANDGIAYAELTVWNRGKGTLRIDKITTECPCTQGTMSQRTIPPGGNAKLRITVDPAKIPGFFSKKMLTIHSNDPRKSMAFLNVYAEVDPEFALEQWPLDFGYLEEGKGGEARFRVVQVQEEPFELIRAQISANTSIFSLDYEEVPEAQWATPNRREYLLKVGVTPSIGEGLHQGKILLTTNVKRIDHFSLAFSAAVNSST